MIITRAPLRISLGGGGTDLPSYYREHSGFVISAAIDKFVYITLHDTFEQDKIIIKYSKVEHPRTVNKIRHPIIKEALKLVPVSSLPQVEIVSMSDIPAGSGLGSSSSFTVALLRALHAHEKHFISRKELAEEACYIEIEKLGEPIGKQDQYIATFGGITSFRFHRTGKVTVRPVKMKSETLFNFEDNLLLFFTGFTRSASKILSEQDTRTRRKDARMLSNLDQIKSLGYESEAALESGDLQEFAKIMHRHWELKKRRSGGMSNSRIDQLYGLALANGALGGKLIGAGGGGFLMFYTEDKTRLRRVLRNEKLHEVRFRFDFEGASLVARS